MRELLKRGHRVVVLDDLSGGFVENLPNVDARSLQFVRGSICDADSVESAFGTAGPAAYVFHLAAYAAEGLSHFVRRFNYENNVIGSVNIVNAAVRHRAKRVVFTSSMAVYGAQQPPFKEDMPPSPCDPYGIAKFAVEIDLGVAAAMWGLHHSIFRPHNVVGAYQHVGDDYRNVIGIWCRQIRRGAPMTVFGDGMQTRALTHVQDIVPCIVDSLACTTSLTCNIGGERVHSIEYLANVTREIAGVPKHPILHLPARHEVIHAFSDHAVARSVLGFEPRHSVEDAIRDLWQWCRDLGEERFAPVRPPVIEVETALPEVWRRRC